MLGYETAVYLQETKGEKFIPEAAFRVGEAIAHVALGHKKSSIPTAPDDNLCYLFGLSEGVKHFANDDPGA